MSRRPRTLAILPLGLLLLALVATPAAAVEVEFSVEAPGAASVYLAGTLLFRGLSRFHIQRATFSLVGFSNPSISFRQ